jgi:hypothetical protein
LSSFDFKLDLLSKYVKNIHISRKVDVGIQTSDCCKINQEIIHNLELLMEKEKTRADRYERHLQQSKRLTIFNRK